MSVCFLSCLVCVLFYFVVIFFFKQKTAYEMRISDWSSDVCSSDLPCHEQGGQQKPGDDAGDEQLDDRFFGQYAVDDHDDARRNQETERAGPGERPHREVAVVAPAGQLPIGRASGRGRGGQVGEISVVDASLKQKKQESTQR